MGKASHRKARKRELYDRVPDIACKGLCYNACAEVYPKAVFKAERGRLDKLDRQLPSFPLRGHYSQSQQTNLESCRFLTEDNRCSVYDERPLICRLWGVVDDAATQMTCPHGCEIDGKPLTTAEGRAMLEEMRVL